jgi:hypothetical protein
MSVHPPPLPGAAQSDSYRGDITPPSRLMTREQAVTQNQGFSAGGGGFPRVPGIIYLIKIIRRRRERRPAEADETTRP